MGTFASARRARSPSPRSGPFRRRAIALLRATVCASPEDRSHAATAHGVVEPLAFDEVIAGGDKAPPVRRAARVSKAAMARHGISDAPALAQADMAIAMETGTDVAIESAGVTWVKGDLTGIVRARRLSRATLRNIRQNLFIAFVYNSLGVPIAAGLLYPFVGLLLSPMLAAAAMSLSSVSVIGNALRLNRVQL